jgi:hypothetical protein
LSAKWSCRSRADDSQALILKRAKFSRSSGQWKDEDYDVLADGKVVGRIYGDASASTPPELRWFWSILEIIRMPGVVTHGHAPTLDEAKAKFPANWTRAKVGGAVPAKKPRPGEGARLGERARATMISANRGRATGGRRGTRNCKHCLLALNCGLIMPTWPLPPAGVRPCVLPFATTPSTGANGRKRRARSRNN